MTEPTIADEPEKKTSLIASSSGRELLLLGLIALTYLTTTTDSQLMPPLLPSIRDGLAAASGGVISPVTRLVTVYGLLASLTSLSIGVFIDRHGAGRLLPLGCLAFALGQAVNFGSGGFVALALGRSLTGVGAASLSLLMMIRINEVFGTDRRSQAFGVFVAGGSASVVVGMPLCLWLVGRGGWNAPFGGLFVAILALGLGIVSFGRGLSSKATQPPHESPGESPGDSAEAASGPQGGFLRALATDRRLVAVLGLGLLFNGGIFAMLTTFGLWCADRFDLGTESIFFYYIGAGLAGVVMGPIAGRLSQRFGVVQTIIAGSVVLALLLPLLALSPTPPIVGTLFVVASVFNLMRLVPYHVLTLQVAGPGYQARFVGLRNAVSQFGIATGAFMGGWIYTSLELGYLAVGVFAAASCLATIPILKYIDR